MRPQEFAEQFRVRGGKRECIELVIAHYCFRLALFAHGAANRQHITDPRTAVDEVSQKEDLPAWVSECALLFAIPQPFQEFNQLVSVTVDVTNDVVHDR
jgi:hypothetical protein